MRWPSDGLIFFLALRVNRLRSASVELRRLGTEEESESSRSKVHRSGVDQLSQALQLGTIHPGCTGRLPPGIQDSKYIFTNKKRHYGIFIDAGSTGSRIRVFMWPERRYSLDEFPLRMTPTGPIAGIPYFSRVQRALNKQTRDESFKVKPGLSAYARENMLEKLGPGDKGNNGLDALLEWASETLKTRGVKREEYKKIPLYLGATAGVRNLPLDERKKLMDSTRAHLLASPFQTYDSYLQTLTEAEEGVLGWVAANYFVARIGCWDASFGVIDMGGASLQITFWAPLDLISSAVEVMLGKEPCPERVCNVSGVPGSTEVFSTSWPNLGQDMMRRQVDALLIEKEAANLAEAEGPLTIVHPCIPSGSTRPADGQTIEMLSEELQEQIKALGDQGVKFIPPDADHFDGCWQLHEEVLGKMQDLCEDPDCKLGNYMPAIPDRMAFFGFNTIWRMRSFLQARIPLGPLYTFADWKQFLKEICEMSLDELITYNRDELGRMGASVPEEYLDKYCMIGIYVVVLFVKFFNFKEDSSRMFCTETLTDRDLEFNTGIGRMLLQVSNLPFYIEDNAGGRGTGIWKSLTAKYVTSILTLILMITCAFFAGLLAPLLWRRFGKALRPPKLSQGQVMQLEMADRALHSW